MKKKARPPSHRPPSRAPRVRPQCVRLSVDDRREKEKERNRAYQKKYRERQRALVNDGHGRSNSITLSPICHNVRQSSVGKTNPLHVLFLPSCTHRSDLTTTVVPLV